MQKYLKRKDVPEENDFQKQLKRWKTETNGVDWIPPEAEVEAVQFGTLSKQEIEGLSAVEVTQPHTQKTNVIQRNGATDARLGTTIRNMLCLTCGCSSSECGVGHSGHLQLKVPIINGEFLKYILKIMDSVCINCCRLRFPKDHPSYESTIAITNDKDRLKKIHTFCKTRTTCESWSDTCRRRKLVQRVKRYGEVAALLDEEEPDAIPTDISVEEFLARGYGCGVAQPTWIAEDNVLLRPIFTLTDEDKQKYDAKDPSWKAPVFTPNDMLFVLSNIPDTDIAILGLNTKHSHPSSLMWSSLYIPTVNIRPSRIGRQGNNRNANEDDLTYRLKVIARNNILLINRIKAQEKKGVDTIVNLAKYSFNGSVYNSVESAFRGEREVVSKKQAVSTFVCYERLYRSVITYQNDKLKGKGTQSFGKVRSSVRTRFSGGGNNGQKKNRIRGSVMGKRMDFTARTVISPNPIMHIREVEVPQMVAMHLTYPARVNSLNIRMLTDMVQRGPHEYPGARYVIDIEGKMIDLDSPIRFSIQLEAGMIVERHMIRGDYVLMNRQPTLHRHSIMAHRVIINPDPNVKSFGLHLAVTTAYNADYDGDEMNMMLLQTEMERAEAQELMLVDQMILKDDITLIRFNQNACAVAHIITKANIHINRNDTAQILMQHMQFKDRFPWVEFEDRSEYTGHEIFSCILPKTLNLRVSDIIIENGVMKAGCWIKSTLNSLIYILFRDHGPTFTADFITGTYNMLNWYATSVQGFTVAMDDVYVPSKVLGLHEISKKCSEYFNQYPQHDIEGKAPDDTIIEQNICSVADRMLSVVGQRAMRYLKSKNTQNGMLDMTASGAKGDVKNVVQVSGIIGQQYNHKSKRFPVETCHFTHKETDRARAHGMVYSNFTLGMNAIEFFNHLRCSRSGLVDTAVKTSRTGYMQRRIAKSLEDMITDASGRVINTQGDIIQERYGNDGFSSQFLETDTFGLFKDDWKSHYEPTYELVFITPIRAVLINTLRFHRDMASMHTVSTPIHMKRILSQCKTKISTKGDILKWKKQFWSRIEPYFKFNLKLQAYFWEHLAVDYLFSIRPDLNELETCIIQHFEKAKIPNGELVGQQAAQSIGEPFTQMTLNTFHIAGSASTLTTGVPRSEEIINTSSKTKLTTPSMKIFFKSNAKTEAQAIAHGNSLVFHALKDFIVMHEINPDREPYEEYIERELKKDCGSDSDVEDDESSDSEEERDGADEDKSESDDLKQEPKNAFEQCEKNFLIIIHVRNLSTPLGRICNRLRAFLKIDSLKWFSGPSWIGLAGSMDDPKLVSWVTGMGLNGYDLNLLTNLLMEHFCVIHACGIRGISDFAVCKMQISDVHEEDHIETKEIFYLVTRGTNLKQVLQLPWVSVMHTTTNDLLEIQNLFGVDAARAAIQRELTNVMSTSGASVKQRHIALLAERMTTNGNITPTTANGICLPGTSVLRNASFESSMDNFLIGALRGDKDECKGMTECVVMNRELQGGTGLVDLRVDTNMKPPVQAPLKYHIPFIAKPDALWLKKFTTPFVPATESASNVAPKGTSTSATRRRKRALQTESSQKQYRSKKRQETSTTVASTNPKTLQNMGFSATNRFKPNGSTFFPFEIHRSDQQGNRNCFKPPNSCFVLFELKK